MAIKMKEEMRIPVITKEKAPSIRKFPTSKISEGAARILQNYGASTEIKNFMALLFLSYIRNVFRLGTPEKLRACVDDLPTEDSIKIALNEFIDDYYDAVPFFASDWIPNQILAIIIKNSTWYEKRFCRSNPVTTTPEPFVKLAVKLLDINKTDSVLDVFSGTGNFMVDAYLDTEADEVYGIELATDAFIASELRSLAMGKVLRIKQDNSLKAKDTADKVFADPPMRLRDSLAFPCGPDDGRIAAIYENIPSMQRPDWTFILSALSKQRKGGRTVILTYEGLLFRTSKGEKDLRRYLVESGKLEAVIALPQGLQFGTGVMRDLLVFSQDNTSVKIVDARDCYTQKRNTRKMTANNIREMTADNIEEVLRRVYSETEYSRVVSHDEIAQREFDLSPAGYLVTHRINVKNGVSLEKLVLSLERAKLIPAAMLKKLSTKEETDYQYLLLKDIENDTICTPLSYLTEIEEDWEKYCVSEGDVVLSRSAPIKIALVPPLHGKKVLANGNMYFMKFDETKIHPIYALCYFKSGEGRQQLEYLLKGVTTPVLSRKDLLRLKIPMISMERQKAIADKYLSIRRHLATLRRQECELENAMASLLEEVD